MEKSENYHKALKYSFWIFAKRNHSEKEIRDKLQRNYNNTVIDRVINKLKDMKLIDDSKFAQEWADYRLRLNKSKLFIKRELLRKGITGEKITEVLNSFNINEKESAYEAIRNKLPRYKKLEPVKAKNKIFQFLTRKGFPYDIIEEILEEFSKKEIDDL
ncbi:MAG: regulatory protein RecX [Elusimicrobia bacterium]|nr:regulatory protein RecX [Elusimicrobiota bacterium]